MSGYNHMSRAAYNDGRNPTGYATGGGYTDDRNMASSGENGYPDHVCRPVIVDAEGRKRPIISYGSPNAGQERPVISYGSPNATEESYVTTRTERVVERVRAPVVVSDYTTYGTQARGEPLTEYGVTNDRRSSPSNMVYDRPEYGYNSPSKMEPVRNYGGGQDRPQRVEDFLTKVQTEASRPTRPGLLSPNLWRNQPNSMAQGYATKGYGGEYGNNNNSNNNNKLLGPMNEIGRAVEVLQEVAKPFSTIGGPRRDGYTDTIDSREAAKRYGSLNLASRPYQTGETYTGSIDSREAARRYGGARV